jgi:hypothetical protein
LHLPDPESRTMREKEDSRKRIKRRWRRENKKIRKRK